MGESILERTGEQAPVVNKGHGTEALGPSDSSDSGSDIVGGPGLSHDADIGLDRGPHDEDRGGDAGADVGDADLSSDSDAGGTGERASAGRDAPLEDGWDIAPDRVVGVDELTDEETAAADDDEADAPPRRP